MFQQPFKTIVVGVDFSPYSKVVVRQAQLLCRIWNAKLVLVHAIDNPIDDSASLYGSVSWLNLSSLQTYISRVRKVYGVKNASTKVIAKSAAPVRLIIETAKQFDHSLIMVGYKGHNLIVEFVFGSTAQQLAMKSKTPVWIHRSDKVIRPQKILIAHDLSRASDRSIDIVKKLALASPTTYEVFHVNQKALPILDYSAFSKVNRQLEKVKQSNVQHLLTEYPRIRVRTASGAVTETIAKRSANFDLLVMAHHNSLSRFSKSETATLMKKVRTPIIVVH